MTAETNPSLPWDALREPQGPIPWDALKRLAHAAGRDEDVRERLQELFEESLESRFDRQSFECLYVPAILAMAASSMPPEARDQAARYFLRAMLEAADEGDETMANVVSTVLGRMGPEIVLPLIVEAMPKDYRPWSVSLALWAMAALVLDTDAPQYREPIIRLCVEALEKADRGEVEIDEVSWAAYLLGRLGYREARALVQRIQDKAQSPDLDDYLDLMDGNWEIDPEDPGYAELWKRPVKEWVPQYHQFLQQEYRGDQDWAARQASRPPTAGPATWRAISTSSRRLWPS